MNTVHSLDLTEELSKGGTNANNFLSVLAKRIKLLVRLYSD